MKKYIVLNISKLNTVWADEMVIVIASSNNKQELIQIVNCSNEQELNNWCNENTDNNNWWIPINYKQYGKCAFTREEQKLIKGAI